MNTDSESTERLINALKGSAYLIVAAINWAALLIMLGFSAVLESFGDEIGARIAGTEYKPKNLLTGYLVVILLVIVASSAITTSKLAKKFLDR